MNKQIRHTEVLQTYPMSWYLEITLTNIWNTVTTIKTSKLFSGINKSEETVKNENRYLSTVGKGELRDSSWCSASSLFVDFQKINENAYKTLTAPL